MANLSNAKKVMNPDLSESEIVSCGSNFISANRTSDKKWHADDFNRGVFLESGEDLSLASSLLSGGL